MKKLLDFSITPSNYGIFEKCVILDNTIIFVYPSKSTYVIRIDVVLSWYASPHGHISRKGVINRKRVRRICEGRCVRLYLENGDFYTISWDCVLRHCEPRYMFFGGFEPYYERLSRRGSKIATERLAWIRTVNENYRKKD